MKVVEPQVFLIGETSIIETGLQAMLEAIGVPEWESDGKSDTEVIVEAAGKLCFDQKTEILTEVGWCLLCDLVPGVAVATLNPKVNQIEFQVPSVIHHYGYSGPMVVFENRDVSFSVTPEHRLWVSNDKENWGFERAEDCLLHRGYIRRGGAAWAGGGYPESVQWPEHIQAKTDGYTSSPGVKISSVVQLTAFAKLLAYHVAEGSINEAGTNKRVVIYGTPHVQEVGDLCGALGLTYNTYTDERNGVVRVLINSRPLADYCEAECGRLSQNIHFPRWVLDLPHDVLEDIWRILVKTDGHSYGSGREVYLTTSHTLSDQVYELLCKLGYGASIKQQKGTNYQVHCVSKKVAEFTVINGKHRVSTENYTGMVYCVTTENGIVLVRRDGKSHFSGNCYMSFDTSLNQNLTKTGTRNNFDYIQQGLIAQKHTSVLEHVAVNIGFINVSRVLTHELIRHRAGAAYSQTSGRYVRTNELSFWIPSCIKNDPQLEVLFTQAVIAQELYLKKMYEVSGIDRMTSKEDFAKKKILTSAFRRIVGNGVATNIEATYNHRALRHIIEMRTSRHAEEEIRLVFNRLFGQLETRYPAIYDDARGVIVDGYYEITFGGGQ